jgi:hypothetical protein
MLPSSHEPPRPSGDVPVFDCRVYLSPPDERGTITARLASLADMTVEGRNEREALRKIVARFKEVVGGYVSRGEPIPWLAEPHQPAASETQRFVPVHL